MKTYDPAWLDRMYNNRALVPAFAEHMASWERDSGIARAQLSCALDLAYGDGEGETLDIFPAKRAPDGELAPVLVFIHGGYWRSLDKVDFSFVAPAFVEKGACVVVPNYALCPGSADQPVTLPHIAMQMVKALAWVSRHIANFGGDPRQITVVGHSAGGHLAAMLRACLWPVYAPDLSKDLVKNALSISGLYDLEPILHTPFLQDSLRLTAKHASMASPAWFPKPDSEGRRGVFYSVAGDLESAEFIRQNELIQQVWGKDVVPVCKNLPELNHFNIVNTLAMPTHELHGMVCELLFDKAL